jgi:hypothetical protein
LLWPYCCCLCLLDAEQFYCCLTSQRRHRANYLAFQQQHQNTVTAQAAAMVATRGKGRLPTHIDTAAAWQQKQQLAQLRNTAAGLPDAAALPVKVAHELRRVLLLLQRFRHKQQTANGSSNSSSSELGEPAMDVDAAVQIAACQIQAVLRQLQPNEAAAACVHAHLFAAWARGVTAAAAAARGDSAGSAVDTAASTPETAAQGSAEDASLPSVVALPAGTAGTWGPISQALTLTNYQYGQLLLLLNAPDTLLDQLAWLQLPAAFNMPWQQQQQQQQTSREVAAAATPQLSRMQLLLTAEVCSAVPVLAVRLLLQLLPQQQEGPDAAGRDDASSSNSSSWQVEPVPAVLLLCMCAMATSVAGLATALTSTSDKVLCLHVLSKAVQLLLPAAKQQQQQGEQQLGSGAVFLLPEAVVQLIRSAAVKATAQDDQQQQQQASGNCWSQHSTAIVQVSCQQLLAGLLQLLQVLLLQWSDSWYSSSSSSSSSEAQCCSTSVTASDVQSQLQHIQQQLHQLLPLYLAAEQAADKQQVQQQIDSDGSSSGASGVLLQQLLPASLTHQLLVHTNSRLALTLMMMQMQIPNQQQQQQQQQAFGSHAQQAAAAVHSRNSSYAGDWTAVVEDPFGRTAQQLLSGTAASSHADHQPPRASLQDAAWSDGAPNSSSSSSTQLSWLNCFAASQVDSASQGTWISKGSSAATSSDIPKAAAAAAVQRRLPCSFLRSRQRQQEQEEVVILSAPVYSAETQQQQQQQQLAVQAAASHLAGLAAAWLTPGYSLGPLLQPPTRADSSDAHGMQAKGTAAAAATACSSGSATGLFMHVAAAAGTSTYGHLRVCCCLLQMLLHAVAINTLQQQQVQQQQGRIISWQSRCPGLTQLLLAMLAEATQQLEQPEQQQALLSALHSEVDFTTLSFQQQGSQQGLEQGSGLGLIGRTLEGFAGQQGFAAAGCSPWSWLQQQLSSQMHFNFAAAASRGLVAASNKLVEQSEDDIGDSAAAAAAAAAGTAAGGGVVTRVVLPKQRQEALLLAELSRVLLLYQAMWPALTVRRLLLDAVQHR